MRLRGELTGSRWKVRYTAQMAAIRPKGLFGPKWFPRSPPLARQRLGWSNTSSVGKQIGESGV